MVKETCLHIGPEEANGFALRSSLMVHLPPPPQPHRSEPDAELVVPPSPPGNLLSISPPPGLPPPQEQPQQEQQQQEPNALLQTETPKLVKLVKIYCAAVTARQFIEQLCQPHKRFQLVP